MGPQAGTPDPAVKGFLFLGLPVPRCLWLVSAIPAGSPAAQQTANLLTAWPGPSLAHT